MSQNYYDSYGIKYPDMATQPFNHPINARVGYFPFSH